MDLLEIAHTRNQIHELVVMILELRQELRANQNYLNKVESALKTRKLKNNPDLLKAREEYAQAIKEIHETISNTLEMITQLRLKVKPRAYIQVTNKLI